MMIAAVAKVMIDPRNVPIIGLVKNEMIRRPLLISKGNQLLVFELH